MKTVTIQIGNSDDRLRQVEWADFTYELREVIAEYAPCIHFFGASPPFECWQNCCVVFNCHENWILHLRNKVSLLGKKYKQTSVAWTEGETEFI